MESSFLISVNYSFSVIKIAVASVNIVAGGLNMYGCVSLVAPECVVCLIAIFFSISNPE